MGVCSAVSGSVPGGHAPAGALATGGLQWTTLHCKDRQPVADDAARSAAVDTLGHLLALHVTAADEQDRAQVERLAAEVQHITGDHVELAYVDQGYTGQAAEEAAASHGIQLEVIKHTEAKRGFVLLPRRWVVERNFAWAARFRRLARDYERLSETLAGYHYLAFAWLMLANLFKLLSPSS